GRVYKNNVKDWPGFRRQWRTQENAAPSRVHTGGWSRQVVTQTRQNTRKLHDEIAGACDAAQPRRPLLHRRDAVCVLWVTPLARIAPSRSGELPVAEKSCIRLRDIS